MKIKTLLIVTSLLILFTCSNYDDKKITTDLVANPFTANKDVEKVALPKIEFNQDLYDFGEINQKESIHAEFLLKNVGDAPLLIRSAKGSCGCTVPDWPSEPIGVGDEAVIKVTFNSENKKGKQKKIVTLVTNAIPSTRVLTITGTVLVPEKK